MKNHAGGGHDRQDAYLYGHPLGRTKRFRSPADFALHALWLSTDETGDKGNCACKICAPDDIQPGKASDASEDNEDAGGEKRKKPQGGPKQTGKNGNDVHKSGQSTAGSGGGQRKNSNPKDAAKQAMSTTESLTRLGSVQAFPTSSAPSYRPNPVVDASSEQFSKQGATVQTPFFTTMPQPRHTEQQIDLEYFRLVFRTGELIWFCRAEAWGLGVVVRRFIRAHNDPLHEERSYYIQPLSDPFGHLGQFQALQEEQLRPFLAWTTPPLTCQELETANVTYDEVDWQAVINGKYGQCTMDIDGSILAARAIDASFTLFDFVKKATPSSDVEDYFWNGLFFGGEKLWAGDVVRLHSPPHDDNKLYVMFVLGFMERKRPGNTDIIVVGDIYDFVKLKAHDTNVPPDHKLPVRLREDLNYRNSVTAAALGEKTYASLAQKGARIEARQIKGRWYESGVLLPFLKGPSFAEYILTKDAGDTGQFLNSRSRDLPGLGVRKDFRLDAFGRSVPLNTELVEGIDPPPIQDQASGVTYDDPSQHEQPFESAPDQLLPDHANLEEFMNLENVDAENVGAYGPSYTTYNQQYY